MSTRTDALLDTVLALPPDERSELVIALLDSLEDDDPQSITDAWRDEIRRRKEDIEAGRVRLVPWTEARDRLLAL
ncbi:MAG: addiction module protein [Burkholderiaceae bacterium]